MLVLFSFEIVRMLACLHVDAVIRETMLREHGYETRIVIMDLKLVPQGVHVLKHIPFTALYSEEMMLQA